MAYTAHTWEVNEAITKTKMNTLENAVQDASNQVDSINAVIGDRGTNQSSIMQRLKDVETEAATAKSNAADALTKANEADAKTTPGSNAWTQVEGATTRHDPAYTNLDNRFTRDEGLIRDAQDTADAAIREINLAHDVQYANDTLDDRFDRIETLNETQKTQIGTLISDIKQAANTQDTDSLKVALQRMEGHTQDVDDEVTAARGEKANGTERDSLLEHFIDDEALINQAQTDANTANTEVGKIKATLGVTVSATPAKTVAAMITDAQTAAQQFATAAIATNNTDTKVGEIIGAHRTGLVDDQNAPIEDTLDRRFDDIESAIDGLNNASTGVIKGINDKITTIANELAMVDGSGAIVDTNTRVDRLNDNVLALGKEIGMLSDETQLLPLAQEIDRSSTRIDSLDEDINKPTTGLKAKVATIENDLNAETGIKAVLAATKTTAEAAKATADTAVQPTDLAYSTLISDVATLKDKDTIVKPRPQSGTNYVNGNPNIATIDIKPNADYLIQGDGTDDKYYYWRYINNAWVMISGAGGEGGGGGNNNAETYETEQAFNNAAKSDNKDYYVHESDGYHHYRYIKTTVDNVETWTKIEIGSINDINKDNIKRYNIGKREVTTRPEGSNTDITINYLDLYEYDYGVNNSNTDTLPTGARVLTSIELPAGGSGAGVNLTPKFVRITPASVQTIKNENKIYLRFFYAAKDITQDLVPASYILRKGNVVIKNEPLLNSGDPDATVSGWPSTTPIPAGYEQIDVTNYCNLGDNVFEISLTANGQTFTRSWTINIIELRLESDSPLTAAAPVGNTIAIQFTPFGALEKTLYIQVDGTTVDTRVLGASVSGDVEQYEIPSQTHGAHEIKIFMKAEINGSEETTEPIIRKYLWYNEADENNPIIISALPTLNQEGKIVVDQYNTVSIPYMVYNKNASTFQVEYYFDYNPSGTNEPFNSITLERNTQTTLEYTPQIYDNQDHTLTIKVGNTTAVFTIDIQESPVNVSPVAGAIIDFDPATLTNNSMNREPSWIVNNTTYRMTASPNFNWSTNVEDSGGGYREDEDGKCFIIKAGTYVDLDYKMFKQRTVGGSTGSAVFNTGAEMKVIFKTKAVRDADPAASVWLTNMGKYSNNNDKQVGIQLSAHEGVLKTDKAVDTSQSSAGTEYPAWSGSADYNIDDIVVDNKIIYKRIAAGENITALAIPGSSYNTGGDDPQPYWEEQQSLPSGASATDWAIKTVYKVGAYVRYETRIYKCVTAVTNLAPKKDTDNWLAMGQIDTNTSATNSYLYFPYSEEDKIELDININTSGGKENFIMSYEDGVPSKAYAYDAKSGGDILYHVANQESSIRIGSANCDVYIYRIRIYPNALTTAQILKNFIADGKDIEEKLARYWRNAIYYDSTKAEGKRFTPYASASAKLDPIQLSKQIPDVKVLMLETPQFTTGKKNFIKDSTLRCLHAQGGKVYPATDADNWFFFNGYHAGQGTTSDNYGQAGRNVDFLFECDGKHYPTKKKNMTDFTKGYQSTVVVGDNASVFDNNSWKVNDDTEVTVVENVCTDWMDDSCKISLTHDKDTGADTSIPNNYFNLKVNIASSENVNNALFQKRYNDYLPYKSPAYRRDPRIKNTMEFVPAVLFLRETGPIADHKEFQDTDWHFYALGNIGDSKKSDYTRAYNPEDMNEFTVEVSDNNTSNSQFQSGVILGENNERLIETDMYESWDEHTAYAAGAEVGYQGRCYRRIGGTQEVIEGETPTFEWVDADWVRIPGFADMNTATIDPMEYTYPIDEEAEWNRTYTKIVNGKAETHYVNYRHETLSTEGFDGDHSFEFRYACRGDYRDGDLINDTNGGSLTPGKTNDDIQFDKNRQIVENFYKWIITADNSTFHDEASHWFVPEAVEYFYAFTHFYTMMDNRAKNTFWHWGKRYISNNDANGTNYHNAIEAVTNAEIALQEAEEAYDEIYAVQGPIIDAATADLENAEATLANDPQNAQALQDKANAQSTINDANEILAPYESQKDMAERTLTVRELKRDELKFLYEHANCYDVSDSEAAINEGRRFDLWTYDCDTACGIDNNGELIFPYGKEDEDYRVADDPASGWAFNGSGSIFWRRLSRTFSSEINALMNSLPDNCFSTAQHLISEFDKFQECFPEELWRKDIERKYIRTFTGDSYDGSVILGKQNIRFLKAMMQGRKKYQRRQWVRDQSIYFGSKYFLSNVRTADHIIEFATYTPTAGAGETLAVPIDQAHLEITPYQDMYIRVSVGNATTNIMDRNIATRAKAGEKVIVDCRGGSASQETRVDIYGAEYIAKLENLAPMYMYSGSFGNARRLKKLVVGSDNNLYNNSRFTQFNINEEMPILEELNIKNCSSLADTIKLSKSNNLRIVEAEGSAIGGLTLPDYSCIETLHLPNTITGIVLKGARNLNDFYIKNKATGNEDYSRLNILDIEDSDYSSNINWMTIAKAMLPNADKIMLLGLNTSTIQTINELQAFADKKEEIEVDYDEFENLITKIHLSGTLTVNGAWSTVEKTAYETLWSDPPLTLNCLGTETTKHKVEYKYDPNTKGGQTIMTIYVNSGSSIVDIISSGALHDMPTKARDARNTYTFGSLTAAGTYKTLSGWRRTGQAEGYEIPLSEDNSVTSITKDWVFETHFVGTPRTYNIRWYLERNNESSFVKQSDIAANYGGGYDIVAPTISDIIAANKSPITTDISGSIFSYRIFNGWEQLPVDIRPDGSTDNYNIYASWIDGTVNYDLLDEHSNLTPEILLALSQSPNDADRRKVLAAYDQLEVTMGYNGIVEGEELLSSPLRFDSLTGYSARAAGVSAARPDGIQPFKDSSKPFTLAIDFRFNTTELATLTQKHEAVLVGCEDRNVGGSVQSFKLFYDFATQTPRLSFGDTIAGNRISQSVALGNSTTAGYRNIVVICHPANSDYLDVYTTYNDGVGNEDPVGIMKQYIPDKFVHRINWTGSKSRNTNAPLVFGDRGIGENQDTIIAGLGTIYWAKYWAEDLGAGECAQLAAWPHEKVVFAVEDYQGMQPQRVVSTQVVQPNIVLTALTASETARLTINSAPTTNGSIISWKNSELQTYANERIFNGLPIKMQAIISNSGVRSAQAQRGYDTFYMASAYNLNGIIDNSFDKVFFPSYVELSNDTSTGYAYEATRGYTWANSTQATVYKYTASSNTPSSVASKTDYVRFRFPMVPLAENPKVYIYPTNQSETLYEKLVRNNQLERGIVLIPDDDSASAYVYVTSEDILNGAPVRPGTGIFNCQYGGWVPAEPYWTRSVYTSNLTSYPFMYVRADGNLTTTAPTGVGVLTCGLDYSISI